MGKKLGKALSWTAIHLGAFLLAVWFFMGITPYEAMRKTSKQLNGYIYDVKSLWNDFFDASSRLGAKANKYGLQEAKDVMAGKDYYEGFDINKHAR